MMPLSILEALNMLSVGSMSWADAEAAGFTQALLVRLRARQLITLTRISITPKGEAYRQARSTCG